jgi:hypothetical protein
MTCSLVHARDRAVPERFTGTEYAALMRALYSRAPRNAVQLAQLRDRLGTTAFSGRVDSSLLCAVNT